MHKLIILLLVCYSSFVWANNKTSKKSFIPERLPFEIYIDDYKCVNPICPDCIIDNDITYIIKNSEIKAKSEFISKNGFELQQVKR